MDEFCVVCGEVIPEGVQVGPRCMGEATSVKPNEVQELRRICDMLDKVHPRVLLVEAAKSCLRAVIERMEAV